MSIEESIRIIPRDDIALIEWDMVGEKVNKLSSPMMVRLKEILEELKQSSFKAVVMVSRKPGIFIAGADIDEIKTMRKKEDFSEKVREGQQIFNLLEDLPMPTIAAIEGACVGGGCEMVMACDYRIMADSSSSKIGLPETKLGIIPGFGGCVRMPRLLGLQNSLDIILAGKTVPAKKAAKIGLVDEMVPAAIVEERAFEKAREFVSSGKKPKRKSFQPRNTMDKFLESMVGRPVVFKQARKTVLKTTHGHYPAPLKAIEVIQKTYTMKNREAALATEAEGFAEVATTDVSRYLIELFFMMEAAKKRPGALADVKPKSVERMGVLGAGTMGGGIAQVAADKGVFVRLKDVNNSALAIGFASARKVWEKALKRKRISKYELQQKMDRITGGLDYSGFGPLDVVVEAIVEDMNIKKSVLGEAAKHTEDDCIFATNTSSLSVTEMAEGCPRPENFVGMHFFNPVHRMPLVEVIRGEKTSDVATATIYELAKKMGKTPVVVKDGPGFLVNRLLLPYLAEAGFLLADGMAVDKVDRIYVKEFGMPMGPFHLMDEIGIDVCAKVLKIFKKALGARIETSPLIEKLNEQGHLGKKSGQGFYQWNEGKRGDVVPNLYKDLGLGTPSNSLSDKECLQRGLFMMINEAALALLEERIVETPRELDLAMIMGTGFPPFRGGLLKYADSLGSEYIANELEVYANQYSGRFKPSQPLSNMAKTNRKFYST